MPGRHGLARWALLLSLTATAGVTGWRWLAPGAASRPAIAVPTPSTPWWAHAPFASPTLVTPAGPHTRAPDTLRQVLYQGSFAGTQPFGDWCVTPQGQLAPCPGLRDRFEYYINGLGEITPEEVRALIEDEAQRAHGSRLASEIMAIFDAYWQVRTHVYPSRIDVADADTWLPALKEAQAWRQQMLGEAWARAFYGADDQAFLSLIAQARTGQPPPPSPRDPVPQMAPGKDPQAVRAEREARYGAEVATRLEALDAEQAAFDQQVVLVRQEWMRLQAQAHLSAPARDAQLQAYIADHIEAKNRRRAWALATATP